MENDQLTVYIDWNFDYLIFVSCLLLNGVDNSCFILFKDLQHSNVYINSTSSKVAMWSQPTVIRSKWLFYFWLWRRVKYSYNRILTYADRNRSCAQWKNIYYLIIVFGQKTSQIFNKWWLPSEKNYIFYIMCLLAGSIHAGLLLYDNNDISLPVTLLSLIFTVT